MKTSENSPSIFDSFNARSKTPEEVAKSFIPPSQFEQLVKLSHNLIVGPRGSGKTTLLKMLQISALETWNHPDAEIYRSKVNYSSVFIPADTSWGSQIDAIVFGLSPEYQRVLQVSAFTTHVLTAFIDTVRRRTEKNPFSTFRRIGWDNTTEAKFVSRVSNAWELDLKIDSLFDLKLGLKKRLLDLATLAERVRLKAGVLSDVETEFDSYLFLDFLTAISFGIDAFNELSGERDGKWALLFDELEIAPRHIRQNLFRALRSFDNRIVLKLSISPYSDDMEMLNQPVAADSGHDYIPIKLWYAKKEQSSDFSKALLNLMLKDVGLEHVNPQTIFGSTTDEETIGGYQPSSTQVKILRNLSNGDPSFQRYLSHNKIDLNKLQQMDEVERAALVRKIRSIASIRLEFGKYDQSDGSKELARSRKNPLYYTGASALFAIVEGNPRWFIGIVSSLIVEYKKEFKQVRKTVQAKEITRATNRFKAMLNTINCLYPKPRGLIFLIDEIGEYFFEKTVLEDFTAEPPGTFTVDHDAPDTLVKAIGIALNCGALIYIPESDNDNPICGIRGKRFRISYLLAPEYKLPLILGRSVSLSRILGCYNDKMQLNIFDNL